MKAWEGCLTIPILYYRIGHQLLAGAGTPAPQMHPIILGKASGQVKTQGRNSLLHAINYTGAPQTRPRSHLSHNWNTQILVKQQMHVRLCEKGEAVRVPQEKGRGEQDTGLLMRAAACFLP